ncbi:hypothetical protein JCM21900_005106 [Sporobolomyces salmonicolor]
MNNPSLPSSTLSTYTNLVRSGDALVVRIDRKRWVLEDYGDVGLKAGHFVHVEGEDVDGATESLCSCPHRDQPLLCIHRQFIENELDLFKRELRVMVEENPVAVIDHEQHDSDSVLLSVCQARSPHSMDGKCTFSTTPLAAFWPTVNYAYLEHGIHWQFLLCETFNDVYFAFIALQATNAPLTCPICGPEPYAVVADGISLSFSSELTHTDLHPPTIASGAVCPEVHAQQNQPFLPPHPLWRTIKATVEDLKDATSNFAVTSGTVALLRTFGGAPLDNAIT